MAFHFFDCRIVALVERPLLDPFAADKAGARQDLQMLTGGWLSDAKLLGDQQATNPVVDQVTVHLRRKMLGRSFEPLQNLESLFITERAKRVFEVHIDT